MNPFKQPAIFLLCLIFTVSAHMRHGLRFFYDNNIFSDYSGKNDMIINAFSEGENNSSAGEGKRNIFSYAADVQKYLLNAAEDNMRLALEYERRKILKSGIFKIGGGTGYVHFFQKSDLRSLQMFLPLEYRRDWKNASLYFPLRFQYDLYPQSENDIFNIAFTPHYSWDPIYKITLDLLLYIKFSAQTELNHLNADFTDSGKKITGLTGGPEIKMTLNFTPAVKAGAFYRFTRHKSDYAAVTGINYIAEYDTYSHHQTGIIWNGLFLKRLYISTAAGLEGKTWDDRPAYSSPLIISSSAIRNEILFLEIDARIRIAKIFYLGFSWTGRITDSNDYFSETRGNKASARAELVF
ncbi:MAG: hypothetical protein A2096_16095 [Spirochaetes bacterium GWF1_41_5]|nr:MAG: hypothetical protein A2096_16095 [Spirochaetes bacterium GWF1_41_5]HBE04524.1 hypothetical protein [Spirochaetia bacterium]